ncbi:MAG TPA: hypothetical protein VGP07_08520 [Polyangia bacterium]|jgi:hypothetical protein
MLDDSQQVDDRPSPIAARAAAFALAWLVATGAAGCRRAVDTPAPTPSVGDAIPTWSRDVAPLLVRRCGGCHGDGVLPATAPPALGSYDEARRAAAAALRAVRRRMMPPFGPDDTGLCGSWLDASWLTDAEIATFDAWVEHGTPRGDDARAPASPIASAPPSAPPLTLDPRVAFAPGVGGRAYRCFVVEGPRPSARFLTAVTVTAEPAAAVRQATLYALDGAGAVHRAHKLEAADAEPGWACYGAPRIVGARLVASWSRNTPGQPMPAGTGVPLDGVAAFVMQVRYDLIASAPGTPVSARFALTTGETAQPARLVPVRAAPFTLALGSAQARVRVSWTSDRKTTLLGLVPRMHTLGRVLDLARTRAGQQLQCLAHFGHWDIYDQQLFRAVEPIALAPGDELTLTCEFTTTSRAGDVKMGEDPDDEQCLAHLYLVDPP